MIPTYGHQRLENAKQAVTPVGQGLPLATSWDRPLG
ncbi:hypothetical protein CYA_0987 [Synechococcus sp. JA-3-3Ab]|nr:hypothetical protein CYA_0987 [Synechococcus sp. JA-3-3Ab]